MSLCSVSLEEDKVFLSNFLKIEMKLWSSLYERSDNLLIPVDNKHMGLFLLVSFGHAPFSELIQEILYLFFITSFLRKEKKTKIKTLKFKNH